MMVNLNYLKIASIANHFVKHAKMKISVKIVLKLLRYQMESVHVKLKR